MPITDKRMTRFNITIDQAVNFVLTCMSHSFGGEIFVPKIPSYKITTLAKAVAENSKTVITGIRPGEKIHEELITESDSLNALEYKNEYIILPNTFGSNLTKKKYLKKTSGTKGKICDRDFKYTSKNNKHFLTVGEIKSLIKKIKS